MAEDDDRVCSIDGLVFRDPAEQQTYLRFIREEGLIVLALYASIEDRSVRAAILDLVRAFATACADSF